MTIPIVSITNGQFTRDMRDLTIVRIVGECVWFCETCGSRAFIVGDVILCKSCAEKTGSE